MKHKNFWHPAQWKWLVVVGLLVWALFLAGVPFKFFPRKPKLIPRGKLAPVWDGAYAKLVFKWQADISNQLKFTSTVINQPPTLLHGQPVEQFEVDLHSGEFILRQTDFFIPDVIPLALIRAYHSWDYQAHAFGMGANHAYDMAPSGSRNPYTFIDLNLEDGREIHFNRISEGTGYADAVYEHDDTSSEFYGARFSWNGDGWDLRLRDGSVYLFPEAYHAKNSAQAAAYDVKDGMGRRVQLLRDRTGNLIRIISPSGRVLDLTFDENARVVRADDGEDIRFYAYDSTGHLTQVSENGHKLFTFEYSAVPMGKGWDDHLMTGISDASGRKIVQNKYADTRIVEQRLGDGKIYRYKYQTGSNEVLATTVELPDGKVKVFRFFLGRLIPE